MLKAEQIPDAVIDAAVAMRDRGGSMSDIIRTAINAWPGMSTGPNIYGRRGAVMHLPPASAGGRGNRLGQTAGQGGVVMIDDGMPVGDPKDRQITALRAEVERLRSAITNLQHDIQQTLGRALGYPWFKNDQKNFPGSTEADGVCVGDHVAESLADEAADKIAALRAENEDLGNRLHHVHRLWANNEHALRAENERLRAALREIIADSFSIYAIAVARAALGGKDE